jgi:putative transposase
MYFEKGHLYHVINRSSAGRKVFINRENYIFFLRKIRKQLLDHCCIIAYCLMPTHFHLMIYVANPELKLKNTADPTKSKTRTINQSFGIMLRSYTSALQNQEHFSGSLFQQHSKAVCLTKPAGLSPAWFNTMFGTKINILTPEKEYTQVCFDYVHNNPVAANLVSKPEEWEFSSYRDYSGLRQGTLVDKRIAEDFGLKYRQ